MTKFKIVYIFFSGIVFFLVFIAATTAPDDALYITHSVKKGETVSLLCIDIYGYYSKSLASAFQKDNPAVKNINLIFVNQKLLFRKPIKPGDKTTSVADTVYYQKVDATQGVVTYVEGNAFLKKSGSKTEDKLPANVVVQPGDVIKTGKNGRVELIINRESVVRLKENTELTIDAFRDLKKNEGKTALNFSIGSLWSKVKQFKDKISRFELEMPTAIAGVHGTIYQTTVNKDSSAEVKVFNGEVAVSGKSPEKSKPRLLTKPVQVSGPHQVSVEEWTRIVRSMQAIKINKQGKPSDAIDIVKTPSDSWTKWNEERDQRIAEMFSEK